MGHERGLPGLTLQFLAWVEARPRSYGETMDAWRTSCPRLPVWEDALDEGLVMLDTAAGAQAEVQVRLTGAGRERLRNGAWADASAP